MSLARWQSNYHIQQTESINEHPKFRSTDIGIKGTGSAAGKFIFPITNRPHLPISPQLRENILVTGRADKRTIEFVQDILDPPTFTLEMPANAYNLSLFLWLLFQRGASETTSGSVVTSTFIPYTSVDIEVYTAVSRSMVDAITTINQDTTSHLILGCICQSLTISAEERGILRLSAEMIGASHRLYNTLGKLESTYNYPRLNWNSISVTDTLTVSHNGTAYTLKTNVASDGFTDPADLATNEYEVATTAFTNSLTGESIAIGDFNFPDDHVDDIMTISIEGESGTWDSLGLDDSSFLKYQDANIYLGDDVDNLVATKLPGFSMTFLNNAVTKFFSSSSVDSFQLGKLQGNGTIFIPFGETKGGNNPLNAFKNEENVYFRIYWGSSGATSDGEFSITTGIRYSGISYEGDAEIGAQSSFTGVYTGTQALSIKCGYGSSKLIRGIV